MVALVQQSRRKNSEEQFRKELLALGRNLSPLFTHVAVSHANGPSRWAGLAGSDG
jgi:hypothetical protein